MPCTDVTVEPDLEWKPGANSVSLIVKMKVHVLITLPSVLGTEAQPLMKNLAIVSLEMDKMLLLNSVTLHVKMVIHAHYTINTVNGTES
jgi:hypothetical protein